MSLRSHIQSVVARVPADCKECQSLQDSFLRAAQDLIALHGEHILAVMNDEPEPHRFDLLIHEASERKQNAKYAYVHHKETHSLLHTNETHSN